MNGTTTYSFKDLVGSIISALAGPYILAGGKLGVGKILINNTTMNSDQETATDGAVMVNYISGSAGDITIDCQQTSALHKWLLAAFNMHKTAADSDDVSNWIQISINLRNILDGTEHELTGVSFTQIPPKAYDARGGMMSWKLLAANAVAQ